MLVGSRALKYHIPNFPVRSDSDWDFIGNKTRETTYGNIVEIHSLELLNNKKCVELFNENGICSLEGLAYIKRSHLHRDLKFDKHITDYHKWILPSLKSKSINLDNEFLKERISLTKKEFPIGNPKLTKTNEDFFDDAVDKKYDHDWLHSLYAYGKTPIYEKLKYPDKKSKAWCEKKLWDQLPHNEKIMCVCEEVYVIATERFLVPCEFNMPEKLAYYKALKKVCTTLTSGWFRDFAIDNYPQIVDIYDEKKIIDVAEKLS